MNLRTLRRFFFISLVMLGLVVTALVSAVITMRFAIHGHEVKVPVLKGMTIAEARSQTSGLGLNLEVDNRYYSADVAAGHILSQSPNPNAVVRREWRVRVAESLGPQRVDVPSVIGTAERAAALNLRRTGLEAGAIARLPWVRPNCSAKCTPIGNILAQDPPPHAQGIERPGINLLIAAEDDTPPNGFVMPDLTGLPIVTAQAMLNRVGIKSAEPRFVDQAIPSVSNIASNAGSAHPSSPSPGPGPSQSSAASSSSPAPAASQSATPAAPGSAPAPPPMKSTALPGTVVGQSPPSGYRVEVGSTVVLTVAK